MISVEEIKKQALKNYKYFLTDLIEKKSYNPIEIRFGKVKSKDLTGNPFKISDEIKELRNNSKQILGFGYTIDFKIQNTQQFGKQEFPEKIYFQNELDFLKFIKKEKEVKKFKENINLILTNLPDSKDFFIKYPLKVIDNELIWIDLIKVCKYFLENPKPCLYIRELPIKIHTKFIEHNKKIIGEILDKILPEASLNPEFKEFEKRFGLKYDQSLIRFRFLDSKLFIGNMSDISLTENEFESLKFYCKNVFITENKINFLTFPMIKNSIVIFGKGFNISNLKNANWLNEKDIFYWGDIDTHGLQILSQITGYFPKTKSIMMDFETLNHFKNKCGKGENTNVSELVNLTDKEIRLFNHLKEKNLRLEQEKITQEYVDEYLKKIFRDEVI